MIKPTLIIMAAGMGSRYGGFDKIVTAPPNRIKPWGTAHAVLSYRDVVKTSFAVMLATIAGELKLAQRTTEDMFINGEDDDSDTDDEKAR